MSNSGLFITLEGTEGCGKSTQAKLLAEYLQSLGHSVVLTREPGGTELGSKIRTILLDKSNSIDNLAEILLFAADRAQHISQTIKPALEKGQIVICDRYVDSTTAYQSGGKGLDSKLIKAVNDISGASFLPELTIVFEVDIETGLKRATKGGADRFELEDLAFHSRVRDSYREIARQEPKRVKIININGQSIENVQRSVEDVLKVLLNKRESIK
ncbi:MAG: dTMP kinase [Candidatus Margulisiibacteriota bacterium]|jgi:dTMP kinase